MMKILNIRLKRFLKRISQYGGEGITMLSFVIFLIGLLALPKELNISYNTFTITGIVVFFLLLGKSLSGFIHDFLWKENKISAIVNIRDTNYDLGPMVASAEKEIVFAGQNLYGLITRTDFFPLIEEAINRKEPLLVSIIFTTPQAMKSITRIEAVGHLLETTKLVHAFREGLAPEKQEFFKVYYHEGASSISMTAVDPNSKSNGVIVFNAKWSVDESPGSRLYCIVERWENKEIFDNLFGVVAFIKSTNRMTTLEAEMELELMCKEG